MALRTVKAVDLQNGDYLVSVPSASPYNSASSFSSPYPQVSDVGYGTYSGIDGSPAVTYKLNGGPAVNMLAKLDITVSESESDDGKRVKNLPVVFLAAGDLVGSKTISSVQVQVTYSDTSTSLHQVADVVKATVAA